MSLSKNRIKILAKYRMKKNRDSDNVFVAEGGKLIKELLKKFKCTSLIVNENNSEHFTDRFETATEDEMSKITLLKTPRDSYAVFQKPDTQKAYISNDSLTLVLDGVQDPGNVGTIIRTADWFGIENVICTNNCADPYGPKTIQSTMGALTRVNVTEMDNIEDLLDKAKNDGIEIYGTLLDGNDIYKENLRNNGIIIVGSEGNGISENIRNLLTKKIKIENWPSGRETSESLNVASATAIICAEFRSRCR